MSDNYEKTSLQDYPHSPFSKRGFHFPQVYENSLDNNIFLIFRPLLQVGYYLLLIPFRFGKRSDGSYYIHTNLLQQILCTVTLTLVFLTGVLDMRHYFERGLMSRPEKAFAWSYAFILQIGYAPVWFKTFWFGKSKFQDLLDMCQLNCVDVEERKSKKYLWIPTLIIVYSEAKLFLEQVYSDILPDGFTGMLQFYGGIGLYNLRTRDQDQLTVEELYSHWGIVSFSVVYTILTNLLRQLEHLLEIIAVLGAIAVYFCVQRFVLGLKGNVYRQQRTIINNYTHFTTMLNLINSITGSIVFIYMLGMVPTFVWCVFGIFELNSVAYLLYYVHKFVMYLGLLVIAAEGGREANKFKDWILQFVESQAVSGENQDYVLHPGVYEDLPGFDRFLNFAHREMCANPVGLKGGAFFTISYGFIGTTVSVIVTYAVIMLQFQVERYQQGQDGLRNMTA